MSKEKNSRSILEKIDRRIIFLFVAISLALPLIFNIALPPASMPTADDFYRTIEELEKEDGKIAIIAMDWGPGTMAENRPQTEMAIEHLMRRRIPFGLISVYSLASPFLREVPRGIAERLEKETGEKWAYGEDWVNFGYQPGGSIMIQGLAKSKDLHENLERDANSTPIAEIPLMKNVRTIEDVSLFIEVTGLVGVFNSWLQYFQSGSYRPPMLHGCTSITIPEAYIFYSSKQILGFFEGIAGAAWYERLLAKNHTERPEDNVAIRVNTGLSFAHLLIIALVVLGNLGLISSLIKRVKN